MVSYAVYSPSKTRAYNQHIVIYIMYIRLITGPVKGLSNTLPLSFNSALSGQREPYH